LVAVAAPKPPVFEAAPSSVPSPTNAKEKRLVIDAFDYSAVTAQVQSVFGTQQNVGKGIQAMLLTRIREDPNLVAVDRGKVKEATADAIVTGDIVVFGREEPKGGGSFVTTLCRVCGSLAFSKKEQKFVIAINYRLIDPRTGEILATGEARGESKRVTRDWGGIGAALVRGSAGSNAGLDMTSSNFQRTIIGEAAQDCINKLAEDINNKAADVKKAVREAGPGH
jgi:curli biogenesis system outer membrane secretion channel CsgG